MRKVADWQIANPHPAPEHDDLNWPQGALYVGMVDWAELAEKEDNDDTYYKWLTRIGRRNCWQPDKRFYHADDIVVSQSFLDLYRKYKDEAMIILRSPVRNGLSIIRPKAVSSWWRET